MKLASGVASLRTLIGADVRIKVLDVGANPIGTIGLDETTGRQILAMATILHDCYGSYDLVMHLLAHHDTRHATTLAPSYLAGLQGGAGGGA